MTLCCVEIMSIKGYEFVFVIAKYPQRLLSLFCYDVLLSHDNNSLCCHYVFIVRRSSVSCCYEDICPKTPITVDHPPLVTHPRDWADSFLGFLALSFRGGIFSLEHLFV